MGSIGVARPHFPHRAKVRDDVLTAHMPVTWLSAMTGSWFVSASVALRQFRPGRTALPFVEAGLAERASDHRCHRICGASKGTAAPSKRGITRAV